MVGGLPELEVERYLTLVDEQCAAAFAGLDSLVYPRRETRSGDKGAKSGGLLGRLRGMFGG
jgi:hypothetical protein